MRIICIGGFVDYTSQLVHALRQQETVMFVIPVRKIRMDESLAVTGEAVDSYLFARGRSRYHPANLRPLIDCVRKMHQFDPDVVHIQIGASMLYLALLPFIKRYPLVTTFHDVKIHVGEENSFARLRRYWIRRCSDEIIVHGEKLRQKLIEEYHQA